MFLQLELNKLEKRREQILQQLKELRDAAANQPSAAIHPLAVIQPRPLGSLQIQPQEDNTQAQAALREQEMRDRIRELLDRQPY